MNVPMFLYPTGLNLILDLVYSLRFGKEVTTFRSQTLCQPYSSEELQAVSEGATLTRKAGEELW